MSDTAKFLLRMPSDMHAALKAHARENRRSLNSEILYRLGLDLADKKTSKGEPK